MENIWHKVIAGQVHREPNIFPSDPNELTFSRSILSYDGFVFRIFLTERTRIKQVAFLAGP